MLYQENPKLLSSALSSLVGDSSGIQIGVDFRQQVGRNGSIIDGLITQPSFAVYIETKRWDWFYDEQLETYLSELDKETANVKVLLALSNFENKSERDFDNIEETIRTTYQGRILFAAVTFEDFVTAVQQPNISPALAEAVEDFKGYLNGASLLPNWRNWLDVCNCGAFHSQLVSENVYICPASGGAYKHDRCQYLGMYWWKSVRQVAEIWGVVDIAEGENGEAKLLWNNTNRPNQELLDIARTKRIALYPDEDWATRVFVLGPLVETNFEKDSHGGMLGSKRYFGVHDLDPINTADLAEKLRAYSWSDLEE
ncbi:PD-(D/E)XK nuclease family protein [Hymenobacter cheonanensis]|uniref:PD-(D/E)XK nuclease family protein n=1 Tax=Hymenobacter sp. CA2-7 TaxID=3063993 RepID=UPI00271442FC|nr:PD-(D/E)XK nuclease family protein [Hymenobacter sp. CA2-7]MDO7887914.1 PD-(D/E)XK nuclease family protein [Hymenobacter sp. CA2-7]